MDTAHLLSPNDSQVEAFAPIVAHAFALPPKVPPEWFARLGSLSEHMRVWVDQSTVQGGLMYIPMGQWFGGRRLPLVGIAGVAIGSQYRGSGAATRMMREAVLELHRQGVPLSALYPATVPLYQRAGYERAGARYEVEVALRDLVPCRKPELEPLEGRSDPRMQTIYASFARERNGYLDRGDYVWGRVFAPFNRPPAQGFRMGDEGYAVIVHEKASNLVFELTVTDLVARTAEAARRLLGLLGDYRSVTEVARWTGAAPDLVQWLLPDRHHQVRVKEYWMLRLVNLPGALEGRGYNPALSARLELEVSDDLIPQNCGRWTLRVEEGKGTVEPGGEGRLKLDIRALASLYTGFLPASLLLAAGQACADPLTASLASLVFSGPAPACSDMF